MFPILKLIILLLCRTNLMNWLGDTEQQLDQLNSETTINDPEKIKLR